MRAILLVSEKHIRQEMILFAPEKRPGVKTLRTLAVFLVQGSRRLERHAQKCGALPQLWVANIDLK